MTNINNLNELIKYKKRLYERRMWDIIIDLGWGVKSTNYKLIRLSIYDRYSEKEINKLAEFSKFKRKELQNRLKEYEKQIGIPSYYNISDDGFWDLSAHIVGLGKEWYYLVMKNPEIAKDISDNHMYVENFEYIFNKN